MKHSGEKDQLFELKLLQVSCTSVKEDVSGTSVSLHYVISVFWPEPGYHVVVVAASSFSSSNTSLCCI